MFTDDLLEVHRLDIELTFLGEVPDLVDTVMAGPTKTILAPVSMI